MTACGDSCISSTCVARMGGPTNPAVPSSAFSNRGSQVKSRPNSEMPRGGAQTAGFGLAQPRWVLGRPAEGWFRSYSDAGCWFRGYAKRPSYKQAALAPRITGLRVGHHPFARVQPRDSCFCPDALVGKTSAGPKRRRAGALHDAGANGNGYGCAKRLGLRAALRRSSKELAHFSASPLVPNISHCGSRVPG